VFIRVHACQFEKNKRGSKGDDANREILKKFIAKKIPLIYRGVPKRFFCHGKCSVKV
jgi:hypothetical protein